MLWTYSEIAQPLPAPSSPFQSLPDVIAQSSPTNPEICGRSGTLVTGQHLTKPHPQAEQPKVLSAVEDRMDELGASIAQSRRTVALIKVRTPTPTPESDF